MQIESNTLHIIVNTLYRPTRLVQPHLHLQRTSLGVLYDLAVALDADHHTVLYSDPVSWETWRRSITGMYMYVPDAMGYAQG